MEITITGADGKPFLLAKLGVESVTGLRKSGRIVIQENEFFRGDHVEFADRGNKRTRISFTSDRRHDDVGDAEVFLLEHDDLCPKSGWLTFTAVKSSGARAERYMEASVISVVESWNVGATTFHSYEILGGPILSKKPRPT